MDPGTFSGREWLVDSICKFCGIYGVVGVDADWTTIPDNEVWQKKNIINILAF